jgi:hypothetical protein
VDFTGFPFGTFITDQYASLGITFTDGFETIQLSGSYQLDGAGLDGNGPTHVAFAEPMTAFAIHFPGFAQVEVLDQGQSIYVSPIIAGPGAFDLGFLGIISSVPFTGARVIDPIFGDADTDNLYFGPPIPAPGVLTVLAAGLLVQTTRRRC